ncbi:uncharacterized protein DS421_13g412180 [Arachis hypogaea]|nr:uncharacterized protein DS421_13g412180 [Arachis hypogaea]
MISCVYTNSIKSICISQTGCFLKVVLSSYFLSIHILRFWLTMRIKTLSTINYCQLSRLKS